MKKYFEFDPEGSKGTSIDNYHGLSGISGSFGGSMRGLRVDIDRIIQALESQLPELIFMADLNASMMHVRAVSNCTEQQIKDLTEKIAGLAVKYPTPSRDFVLDCLSKLRDLALQGATWDELVGWVESMEDEA